MVLSIEHDSERAALANVLAAGIEDVVEELRVIDPADLVSFIRFGSYPALEDLLQSSTELFFKDGTLVFGWTADVDLSWGDLPTVTLGMEFRHRAVSVFFDLSIRAASRMVDIAGIQFETACQDANERVKQLAEALADAHLPRRMPAGLAAPRR